MGWKIVRDKNEAWCRTHGLSGQWRPSPDPVAALAKKIGEEYGEYVGDREVGELYDLLDVVERLVTLVDPKGFHGAQHQIKIAELGGFEDLVEWTPVPAEPVDPQSEDGWTPDTSQGFPPGAAYEIGRDLALVDEHMHDHLTDGHWHDSCPYCLDRRQRGGTGVPDGDLIGYEFREQQRYEARIAHAKRWESRTASLPNPNQEG